MPDVIESKMIQRQLQDINQCLTAGQFVQVRRRLHELPASDVALLLESSPIRSRTELWDLIDADFHTDVLEELSEDQANYIGVNVNGPYKPEHYRY